MIKRDAERPDDDPLSIERVVRPDGTFDAAAMHAGLNSLMPPQPDAYLQDQGGLITVAQMQNCLTALANLEAMRTFLTATLGRCTAIESHELARRVTAGDVNDMLEAAEYAAATIASELGLHYSAAHHRIAAL